MRRATPQMRQFAERLIAYETRDNKPTKRRIPGAFLVCETLRPVLSTLMGNAGFLALLARARALADREVPWLRIVQIRADVATGRLDPWEAQVDEKEFHEGSVVLVAQLLGLLVAFIGEKLTLGLVKEAWPKVRLDDLGIGPEGKNEKTK